MYAFTAINKNTYYMQNVFIKTFGKYKFIYINMFKM